MINEKEIEKVIQRFVERTNKANITFLKAIAEKIKQIGELSPSKAQQLLQILKYGETYDQIIQKLSKYLDMNVAETNQVVQSYVKKDLDFAERFYQYKDITPDTSILYNTQIQSLSNIIQKQMYDFTRSNVLGYTIKGLDGKNKFVGLRDAYNELLDTAFLNVGQGKQTFDQAMSDILTQIGDSGLKTINYQSGRNVRLDSAVSMHLKSRLRELHNETQKIIGEQFGADGVEISVHEYPAPDHENVQGRQFSKEQFENLQNGLEATDYKENKYTLDHDGKNGYRPISEMNCYHYTFDIILGVSKPLYSDKQLQQIKETNDKGFDYEGKHYTMYQGTQLQRNLERRIREQKDMQILAKESDNQILAGESQNKITVLTRKYKDLSEKSGLPTQLERAKVSKYKRSKQATQAYQTEIDKMKVGQFDINQYTKQIKPTTKDVILTPGRKQHIQDKHPDVAPYYDKITEIISNPDNVYLETKNRKNTVWLTKKYGDANIKLTVKINETTLYQQKQLGYKNSIIQMQILPEQKIIKQVEKGNVKQLFKIK